MARPLKDGVIYFPKDTDFYSDDKVRILRAEFGAKGMYILDYILCEIYGKHGYYITWDNSRCLLVSDGAGCGCSPEFINQFISGCLRCSFFDERVFKLFGVLTSLGIQKRYIRMFNGRDTIRIFEEYCLLDFQEIPSSILNKVALKSVFCKENPDKSKENPDKSKGNPQIKLNEIKLNDINIPPNNPPLRADFPPQGEVSNKSTVENSVEIPVEKRKRFVPPTVDEVKAYCIERKNSINAQAFCDFYQSKGWIVGKTKMRDWKAAIRTWENERAQTSKNQGLKNGDSGSFDTDEFFQLALKKAYNRI